MLHHDRVLSIVLYLFLWSTAVSATATNVYVTPTGAATGNCPDGTASAPNLTPTQFNNGANWGSGTGQIGAGTVVLMCGTFTGGDGASLLTFQGSGSNGSPITLRFDTGANLTAPYWAASGAINDGGNSWLVIDGQISGTTPNGIIQNTANGSPTQTCSNGSLCANQQNSRFIYLTAATANDEIKNLNCNNIYVFDGTVNDTSSGSRGTNCIYFVGVNNVTVDNVLCHDTFLCINGWGNNILSYNNEAYNCSSAEWFGSNVAVSNLIVHDNYFHCSGGDPSHDWTTTSDNNHLVDIFVFPSNIGSGGSGSLNGMYIYNNLLQGGGSCCNSGHIEMEGQFTGVTAIFNNVFNNYPSFEKQGMAIGDSIADLIIVNNTTLGGLENFSGNVDYSVQPTGTIAVQTFQNNVVTGGISLVSVVSGSSMAANSLRANCYEDLTSDGGSSQTFGYNGSNYTTLAGWEGATGQDASPPTVFNTFTNMKINTTGTIGSLQSGSPCIGIGNNLTSLVITALDSDKPAYVGVGGSDTGNSRPSTGAWDAGAYNSNDTAPPNPPTKMQASVQ